MKLDLATIEWLVHIPGSPQGEPICGLLSPEDLALFLCDSLNAALLCIWGFILILAERWNRESQFWKQETELFQKPLETFLLI